MTESRGGVVIRVLSGTPGRFDIRPVRVEEEVRVRVI